MTDDARTDAIRERLEVIAKRNGGRLTPEAVITDAKKPSSPLHGEFEWDLKAAAYAHWVERARQIIRSVRVVITTETMVVNAVAYVRDPDAEHDEQGYVAVEDLRDDPERARSALIYEFSRADALLQRARELAVALSLQDSVDLIRKELRKATERVRVAA